MTRYEFPATVEPEEWTVVFHRKAATRFFSWLALGRFKHVSAFAYLEGLRGWVIVDWRYRGLCVAVLPHSDDACKLLVHLFGGPDSEWIEMRRLPGRKWSSGFRIGSCVGTIKHLLNLPCHALRPDALYRYCRAHGTRRPAVSTATG